MTFCIFSILKHNLIGCQFWNNTEKPIPPCTDRETFFLKITLLQYLMNVFVDDLILVEPYYQIYKGIIIFMIYDCARCLKYQINLGTNI